MNKEEKLKHYEQAINYLIDIQAYFEGCEYFTKKLWTKLENRKNNDPREIKVFFMHLWLHNKFPDIWASPCGCSWSILWDGLDYITGESYSDDNDNPVNRYFEEFKDVQEDFAKWQYDYYCRRR